MILLGIETSCDDAAAAVVEDGKKVLSSVIQNQDPFHAEWRGVVPEIAARRHLVTLLPVIESALKQAGVTPTDLDGLAVTTRPGLIGSLVVGLSTAQALALAWNRPLYGVNHLAAHVYSAQLTETIPYPHMALLVSGGHTLLLDVTGPGDLEILGGTLDDACGEAFDKVAKHLGLPYPGGPALSRLAESGDPKAFDFPPMKVRTDEWAHAFSFSGLKTAVIHQRERFRKKNDPTDADLAASFQERAIGILLEQTREACRAHGRRRAVVVGGVSANALLRKRVAEDHSLLWHLPPLAYCTDNGAMVAGLAWALHTGHHPGLTRLKLHPRNPDERHIA